MPYLEMREIWTPLRLIGIRLFWELKDHHLYIKIGSRHRRRIWPLRVRNT